MTGELFIDLTSHEQSRLAVVLDAIPDFDPAAVLAGETEALRRVRRCACGCRCTQSAR